MSAVLQNVAAPASRAPSSAISVELKKLIHHSAHYLIGILASLALGFISFPIFTRIFSVSDYGTIDLIAKVLLLMTALSKLGLQQSALRFYDGRLFSSDRVAGRRYYSTMFFGTAIAAVTIVAVFLAIIGVAPKSLIGQSLGPLLFLASGLIVIRAMMSVLSVFLRVQERTRLVSLLSVLTKALGLAAILVIIPRFGVSVRSFYSGTILAEGIVIVAIGALFFRDRLLDPFRLDRTLLRAGIAFGLPLIVYELATITLDAGDRLLVRRYLGAYALGYYSVAYGMSDYVNNLLITPLNLALTPIYMRLWTSQGRERTIAFLSQGFDLFVMAAACVLAIAAATSHDAVLLLASSKYRGADTLIPTIIAGLLMYTSHAFVSAGLIIHKKTVVFAKILVVSAVLNIILNCILLPRLGLYAAALNTLLTYAICILLLGRASFRVLPLQLNVRGFIKYAFAGVISWYFASRILLAPSLLSFATRAACTLLSYVLCLYVLDARFRAMCGSVAVKIRSRRSEATQFAVSSGGM